MHVCLQKLLQVVIQESSSVNDLPLLKSAISEKQALQATQLQ